MSIKSQNEFETLMRLDVYKDNQMMQRVIEYFEKDKNSEYRDKLYRDFDRLYNDDNKKHENEVLSEDEVDNLDDEELDERVVEEGREYTKRELLYKELYRRNLKKYYELRKNIHRQDIREEGDISFNDYNFKEILEYETYLRRIDAKFKLISGSYIAKEFEDVSDELNSYVKEEDKYQRTLSKNYDEMYFEIDDLNNRLDEISDKIEMLNPEDKDYEKKYNALIESYIENMAKLHMTEPNILRIQEQEDRKKEQEGEISKGVGTKYQKEIKRDAYDPLNFKAEKEKKNKDKKQGMYYYDDDTRTEDQLEDTIESHVQVIKSNIKAIKLKLENKDFDGLEELINDTKNIIDMYNIDRKALEKDISEEDIELLDNIDVAKLKSMRDKENNRDAVEKDKGFSTELSFVAAISEIASYDEKDDKDIDREIER